MVFSEVNNKSQRGSVLVMASVMAFSMFLLGLAYLGSVNRAVLDTDELVTEVKAYYAAAAGNIDGIVYTTIAQYHRGIVHRGSCGSGVGYCQKDYKYDDRFRKNPPPHFISIENRKPIYREDFYVG